MNTANSSLRQRVVRGSVAVAAVGVLVGGAAWHGFAADKASTPAAAVQAPASVSRSAALGGRDSYADVVKAVAPAVVTIRTEGKAHVSPTTFGDDDEMLRRFFGDQFGRGQQRQTPRRSPKQHALGSGVVVTSDGFILTNNHVIDDADDIRVEFTDGRTFKAKLVGADKPSDLALLKVEAGALPNLALGDSEAVQVGDVVLAVGNPLGLGQTVTMGIISAKGRSTGSGDGSYEDFLQTDAPINHGNSGGALVNLKGELVGINSQIVSTSDGNIGIGFAVPANMARHVMSSLKTDGKVHRSQLGVTVQPVTSDLAESMGLKNVGGAIVSEVAAGSPAEKAGVKPGDVIMSFNGQSVHDFNTLRNRVADTTPGTTASLGIVRDGSEKTLSVKLEELAASKKNGRNTDSADPEDRAALGISVAPLTPEVAARAGLPKDLGGILVQDVSPDGRAADAGIQSGDVILEVNRQPVDNVDALRNAVRRSTDKPTLLLVHREGRNLFVTVRPS